MLDAYNNFTENKDIVNSKYNRLNDIFLFSAFNVSYFVLSIKLEIQRIWKKITTNNDIKVDNVIWGIHPYMCQRMYVCMEIVTYYLAYKKITNKWTRFTCTKFKPRTTKI